MPELKKEDFINFRPCNTFRPESYVRRLKANTEYLGSEWFIPVSDRENWFRAWCFENNHSFRIDTSDYEFIPNYLKEGCFVCTAKIYIDGELASSASAMQLVDSSKDNDPTRLAYNNTLLQTTFTYAKGRALSQLGFSLTGTTGTLNEEGFPAFPEGGIHTSEEPEGEYLAPDPDFPKVMRYEKPEPAKGDVLSRFDQGDQYDKPNPTYAAANPIYGKNSSANYQAPAEKEETTRPVNTMQSTQETAPKTTSTYEEKLQKARTYTVPVGEYKGRTLSDIIARGQDGLQYLRWVAEKFDNENYIGFKNAAIFLLKDYETRVLKQ